MFNKTSQRTEICLANTLIALFPGRFKQYGIEPDSKPAPVLKSDCERY